MNSDAIEKPSDRTLGGIASDSDAKMPGARSAASPEIMMLASDRDPEHRRERERDPRAARCRCATNDSSAQPEARVLQHQARRERDAEHDADDLRGLGDGGDEAPLPTSLRLKTSS